MYICYCVYFNSFCIFIYCTPNARFVVKFSQTEAIPKKKQNQFKPIYVDHLAAQISRSISRLRSYQNGKDALTAVDTYLYLTRFLFIQFMLFTYVIHSGNKKYLHYLQLSA